MPLRQAMVALYRTMNRGVQRRLQLGLIGMVFSGALDVIGIALVLPLMQLLTDADVNSGYLGAVTDFLGYPSRSALILIFAGAVFAAFLIKGAFTLVFNWWMLGVVNRQDAAASVDMFQRYMNADYTFHLRRNSAEVLRTLDRAVHQAYGGAVASFLALAAEVVTVVAVLGVLVVFRPLPALAAIVYFGLVGFGGHRLIDRRSKMAGEVLMSSNRASNQAALQGLGGVKESYVRGAAPYFVASYRQAQQDQAEARRMESFLAMAPRYAIEMLFIVGVALLSLLIFTTGTREQGAATLGLFVAAGFRLLPSLSKILGALSALRVSSRGIDLVLADLEELAESEPDDTEVEPARLTDGIRVESLTYRYPGTQSEVLSDVSFEAHAGSSTAIVGSTGAGKTTLVDVILGLLKPTCGRVLVDGTDLVGMTGAWQRSIGLVPQDVYLFDDTLRANVVFGEMSEDIDSERLGEAIARAQLEELIATMPDGLDTVVGERGVRLSGGQRQRIGIARALYLRPQLLILDEATSALDNETERRITDTIEALRGEVTMIVVAHRLSTVRRCDQLIFMSSGRIESIGTFDEVRDTNETFANLVRLGSLAPLDPQPAPTT